MRSFLVLCIAAALATGVCGDCDACLDGRCYKKHLLPGAAGNPADIDRNTNTLYVIDARQRLKQCNLDIATCRGTAHQTNLSDITVDQRSGDIYGTTYPGVGIFKLDIANDKRILLDSARMVWYMAFRDKVYYASLNGGIYTSEGGISRIVTGTEGSDVTYMFIDKKDDVYFKILFDGIHVVRSRSRAGEPTNFLANNFHGGVDKNGDATFFNWMTDAVYRVTNGQLVEIGAVKEPHYFSTPLFDRDNNLICKLSGNIYHLKQVSNQCTVAISGDIRTIIETTGDMK